MFVVPDEAVELNPEFHGRVELKMASTCESSCRDNRPYASAPERGSALGLFFCGLSTEILSACKSECLSQFATELMNARNTDYGRKRVSFRIGVDKGPRPFACMIFWGFFASLKLDERSYQAIR